MPGPAPKPSKVHALRGNPSKLPKNSVEPTPPSGRPEPPDYLDDVARQEWVSVCDQLDGMGLLSKADRGALELLCVAYSHYRLAETKLAAGEFEVEIGERGHRQVSSWFTISTKERDLYRRMLEQFGLTPAARARLRTEGPQKPGNEVLAKYAAVFTRN